jgi:hypothetical protein
MRNSTCGAEPPSTAVSAAAETSAPKGPVN